MHCLLFNAFSCPLKIYFHIVLYFIISLMNHILKIKYKHFVNQNFCLFLTLQVDDILREHLALAIANCCNWNNNCFEFGRLGAVAPLVSYMGSKEKRVHRSTALALNKISEDPFNCVTLHYSGVVPVNVYFYFFLFK